jgi:hypothetical protein
MIGIVSDDSDLVQSLSAVVECDGQIGWTNRTKGRDRVPSPPDPATDMPPKRIPRRRIEDNDFRKLVRAIVRKGVTI